MPRAEPQNPSPTHPHAQHLNPQVCVPHIVDDDVAIPCLVGLLSDESVAIAAGAADAITMCCTFLDAIPGKGSRTYTLFVLMKQKLSHRILRLQNYAAL